MKRDPRKLRRAAVIAVAVVVVLFGLNHLMTFPMAFRAGNPGAWLGRGPAGKPLHRVYALVEMEPAQNDTPRAAAALELLKKSVMAEDRSAYPTSASLGDFKYWESNRRVLLAPPPSTRSYALTIPPKAVLDFGYALTRYANKPKGFPGRPETTFVVEWQDRDGARELFRKTVKLPPLGFWERNKARARFWHMYVNAELKKPDDMFREQRLDLSALAGRTGTLRFVTTGGEGGQDACLPAMWSAPEIWAERPPAEPVPTNVVIFMIEATPAHIVAPYPGNPGITPNLAAFARQSAVFDRFFVVGSSTQLSVPSYFTGRHFKSLGLPADVFFLAPIVKERFYGQKFASLPEAFGRAGYTTVEFGTDHYLQPTRDFGLDVGFDRIDIMGRRYYAAVDTTLAAMQWLRQNAAKPFLLYVHYDSPHQVDKPCIEDLVRALPLHTGDDRWLYRKYLAQILRADHDFGVLLAALDQLQVRGRTLVVVTADHGNNLNPATAFTIVVPGKVPWETAFLHGQAMGIEDINVPLLIDWPIGPAGAIKSSTPLESVDLFPTLAQLVLKNVNPDTAARMRDLDGKSFAGILDPAFGPAFPGHDVAYNISENGEAIVAHGRWHYALRDQEHSRLLYPGKDAEQIVRGRLFDLDRDPTEAHELSAERPDLLREMRLLLQTNRPAEPTMSLLYLNYPGGHVRGIVGIERRSGAPTAATIPETRAPIMLRPLGDPAGPIAVMSFEADLAGPTGLMLDAPVAWVWIQHGATVVRSGEIKLGPFGLPLLASAGEQALTALTLPDGRPLRPIALTGIAPNLLAASVPPTAYSAAEGVYYYQMTFADLIARNYSDKALSSGVRSILKEWGYIH